MTDLFEQLVAAGSPDARERFLERALPDELPEARKAAWAYGHVLRRRGEIDDPDVLADRLDAFRADYILALREHARLAADPGAKPVAIDEEEPLERTVIAGWHFPEHVALIDVARARGILVLAAAPAQWLAPLDAEGLVFHFREQRSSLQLVRWMKEGRPVYAMVDHCYPETASLDVPFLTYPARTPVGVFRLAERYGYKIKLIAPRADGTRVEVAATHDAADGGDAACHATAAALAEEILRRPARWLMWPSVDQRWIGVEYN